MYACNDVETGYQHGNILCAGAAEERDEGISATMQPIKVLFGDVPKFQNRNHVMSTDNYYTSPEVVELVTNTGNHFVGPVRANRRGIPKHALYQKTGRMKKDRGDLMQMQKVMANGKLMYLVCWMDKRPVHILNSMPSYLVPCNRFS
jgi:hypothetical protein